MPAPAPWSREIDQFQVRTLRAPWTGDEVATLDEEPGATMENTIRGGRSGLLCAKPLHRAERGSVLKVVVHPVQPLYNRQTVQEASSCYWVTPRREEGVVVVVGGGGGILCINTWLGQSSLHISQQLEKVQSTTPLISPEIKRLWILQVSTLLQDDHQHAGFTLMPRTHGRNFRQQMFDVSLLSEIPTVCRLHRTLAVGISDNKNLRFGSQIFRQQNPLSEILIVCTQF
ncbi:hypothetical protein AB205_0201380 [Aquarana catesbeiana]|uniref:Uncharacterized protein n=1 Tax=Aquarana catesbeiana TaxID=8400 RepID=A0A2G9SAQ3_AQUCT|nr:hypothetical protein AB205_0201380 [Aquarana catesbeiana]